MDLPLCGRIQLSVQSFLRDQESRVAGSPAISAISINSPDMFAAEGLYGGADPGMVHSSEEWLAEVSRDR